MDGPQEELLGRKEAYAALLSTTAPHCTAHKYVCVLGWWRIFVFLAAAVASGVRIRAATSRKHH